MKIEIHNHKIPTQRTLNFLRATTLLIILTIIVQSVLWATMLSSETVSFEYLMDWKNYTEYSSLLILIIFIISLLLRIFREKIGVNAKQLNRLLIWNLIALIVSALSIQAEFPQGPIGITIIEHL